MEKQEKQNRLPYKKEELLELIWCDIMNGVSRYQIIDCTYIPHHMDGVGFYLKMK